MPDKNNLTGRIRVVGLVSSAVAVAALALTVLAGNRSLGRNETITQPQQIFLLLASSAVLFVVQAALYVIFRYRQKRTVAKPPRRPNENV